MKGITKHYYLENPRRKSIDEIGLSIFITGYRGKKERKVFKFSGRALVYTAYFLMSYENPNISSQYMINYLKERSLFELQYCGKGEFTEKPEQVEILFHTAPRLRSKSETVSLVQKILA